MPRVGMIGRGEGAASPSNPSCPWTSWAPASCCRSCLPSPALHRAEPNRTDVARRRNSQEFQTIRSEESEKSNLADLWNLAPYR